VSEFLRKDPDVLLISVSILAFADVSSVVVVGKRQLLSLVYGSTSLIRECGGIAWSITITGTQVTPSGPAAWEAHC